MNSRYLITTLLIFVIGFTLKAQVLSPKEFQKQIALTKGALIDVRTPEEYSKGHIEGAKNINVNGSDFKAEVSAFDKNSQYLLYCGVGKRSIKADSIMKTMGFEKIYLLKDGLNGWTKEGLPVTKK